MGYGVTFQYIYTVCRDQVRVIGINLPQAFIIMWGTFKILSELNTRVVLYSAIC